MLAKVEMVPSHTLLIKPFAKVSLMEVMEEPVAISFLNLMKDFMICLISGGKMSKVMMALQEVNFYLFKVLKEKMAKTVVKPSSESHVVHWFTKSSAKSKHKKKDS
jgi:hypothetical protein